MNLPIARKNQGLMEKKEKSKSVWVRATSRFTVIGFGVAMTLGVWGAANLESSEVLATQVTTPMPAQQQAESEQLKFEENEWVDFLNLSPDKAGQFRKAIQVRDDHREAWFKVPGVLLIFVDKDSIGNPVIHVDVKQISPEIGEKIPQHIEGFPVNIVQTSTWYLLLPPVTSGPGLGGPVDHPALSGTQSSGVRSGIFNGRLRADESLSSWTKFSMESKSGCQDGQNFMHWMVADPKFVAREERLIKETRGANLFYDRDAMQARVDSGICVAADDPRLVMKVQ
jgi:hypothetical protein